MWRHSLHHTHARCGEISDFSTSVMWRNCKCLVTNMRYGRVLLLQSCIAELGADCLKQLTQVVIWPPLHPPLAGQQGYASNFSSLTSLKKKKLIDIFLSSPGFLLQPIILSKHFLYLSPSRPANWASRLHTKSKGTTFNFQTQIHHPHWVKSELRYYKAEYKMIQHLTRVQEKVPHCWDGNH